MKATTNNGHVPPSLRQEEQDTRALKQAFSAIADSHQFLNYAQAIIVDNGFSQVVAQLCKRRKHGEQYLMQKIHTLNHSFYPRKPFSRYEQSQHAPLLFSARSDPIKFLTHIVYYETYHQALLAKAKRMAVSKPCEDIIDALWIEMAVNVEFMRCEINKRKLAIKYRE